VPPYIIVEPSVESRASATFIPRTDTLRAIPPERRSDQIEWRYFTRQIGINDAAFSRRHLEGMGATVCHLKQHEILPV
jgi:hypothetical protein